MQTGEAIEPVAVKTFGKNLVPIIQLPDTGLLDTFLSELERTDCRETADGLFFNMAQIRLVSWKAIFQRLRIYIAYAKTGNRQALVCLTHQLLEGLMQNSFDRFWEVKRSELQRITFEELLDFLRDNVRDTNIEPNRRIIGKFLVTLFERIGDVNFQKKIVDILIVGGYPINLKDFRCKEDVLAALRDLVNTEANRAFLIEIDAAFDKRMKLETYDGLVHRKILEAKIATYLFFWNLEKVKKEKRKSEQELRRKVRSIAGDEHI